MPLIEGQYKGNLRTVMTHKGSGASIITDAPKDNEGKGESFSPTDLLASSLGSCLVTIMGIRAKNSGIDLPPFNFTVKKIMQSNPRKVSRIEITINASKNISLKDREYLEKEARECPVALSLSEELIQDINFMYV